MEYVEIVLLCALMAMAISTTFLSILCLISKRGDQNER